MLFSISFLLPINGDTLEEVAMQVSTVDGGRRIF
jgi:hypothetical protein